MSGQVLTGANKLISSNGKFALGFFQSGSISRDGNLVILNIANKSIIWSSQIDNTTNTNRNITVVLSDNGNLGILHASNPTIVWWQSFDHPTDVFLPGAKIGRNKITGQKYSFTSKINFEDPALGLYCMELDPSGARQYYDKLCNSSMVYYSTGEWNGRYFNSVPEMSSNVFLDSRFVDNNDEEYFTYTPFDKTVTTICLVDASGLTKQLIWVEQLQDWELVFIRPKDSCDVFSVCGPFTVCNGNTLPLCNCMKEILVEVTKGLETWGQTRRMHKKYPSLTNKFFPIPSVRLPYDANSMEIVASAQECMQYNDTTSTNGEILYLRLAAAELQSWEHNRRRRTTGVVVGASVSAFSFLAFILPLMIWRSKRRSCGHPMDEIKEGAGIIAFRYAHLQRATKNFSEKIGGGGFGSVFKGILSNSTTIAVKMLDSARQGEKQFRAEVSTIGMIQHVNLVKLIGFCCEGDRRMLVYEYMVNCSLDAHLFQRNGTILNWRTRYHIAIGVAKGLSYLHESCHDCIIHCDIKPENILLDASFIPKVADFGMAKLLGRDFSRVLTTMRGTIGYLAPEWISGVAITQKVDIYSYGMVLLEIISGRRNALEECKSSGNQAVYFPVQAAHKLLKGDVRSLVDPQLQGDVDMEEIETACKVACWCIQDDDFNRPTMGDIVQIEGLVELDMPQVPRLLESILSTPDTTCI
uniref:non-specific serine/threonine protein kinase n=1 Tax=Leersia perrieri TaxID=77586 RepID=A0A0D9W258_9ORYZ